MLGANALLPRILALAVEAESVGRLIHVSSAAVLGNGKLHEESVEPGHLDTAYARSKALGEKSVLDSLPERSCILRPASVHGKDRSMTRSISALARSQASFYSLDNPTPQMLVQNVGAAIAFLATSPTLPRIALQPQEGLTTRTFLATMGCGRQPAHISPTATRIVTAGLSRLASSRAKASARRIELLAFGQAQDPGWLTQAGFVPPAGRDHWGQLAARLARTE